MLPWVGALGPLLDLGLRDSSPRAQIPEEN